VEIFFDQIRFQLAYSKKVLGLSYMKLNLLEVKRKEVKEQNQILHRKNNHAILHYAAMSQAYANKELEKIREIKTPIIGSSKI